MEFLARVTVKISLFSTHHSFMYSSFIIGFMSHLHRAVILLFSHFSLIDVAQTLKRQQLLEV